MYIFDRPIYKAMLIYNTSFPTDASIRILSESCSTGAIVEQRGLKKTVQQGLEWPEGDAIMVIM
jgi:hypothetical protein